MSNKFTFWFIVLFILVLNVYLLIQLRKNFFDIEFEHQKNELIHEKVNRHIAVQESMHNIYVPKSESRVEVYIGTTMSPLEEIKKLKVSPSPIIERLSTLNSSLNVYLATKPEYHDQFNYKFIINPGPKFCGLAHDPLKKDITLIAFVPISVGNFKTRLTIRNTWANSNLFNGLRVVFLTGLSKEKRVNQNLQIESEIYGDIVQADFLDTYKNLTVKTVIGLKWISQYCNNSKFLLKVDDDVVVNTHFLLKYLNAVWKDQPTDTFLCKVMHQRPVIRNQSSKFFMSEQDYEDTIYPTYCLGAGYIMTTDLAPKIVEKSGETKFFVFEDLFATGFIGRKLHASFVNFTKFYYFENQVPDLFAKNSLRGALESAFYIYVNSADQFYPMWNMFYDKFTSFVFKYYFY